MNPKLRVLDLFSGIGGFSLGLERTGGFETVAFCEIEPFPRRVLAKHWPGVPIYDDVRTLTADTLRRDGIAIDCITGGFPCQDISGAGQQAGIVEGSRSGLWSEIARLTSELRPPFVIVENVANLLSGPSDRPGGWFGRVLGDLAELGYDAEWENIPASALGAPHRRERIWLVAYPSEVRCDAGWPEQSLQGIGLARQALLAYAGSLHGEGKFTGSAHSQRRQGSFKRPAGPRGDGFGRWSTQPNVGRVAHGVPDRAHRLAALGNAVVPQIPELIGRAILEARASC
jgi:DNA (cytosine-5)-methyltransferase 1